MDEILAIYLTLGLCFKEAYTAPPSFTTPAGGTATISIDESDAIGTSIYSVTATDTDNDITSYSVTGSGVTHFQMDGQNVKTILLFDYESTTSYVVLIVCTDATSNVATATLTVNINDVNEFTPTFTPSLISTSIAENTAAGTSVATVTCADSDASTSSCTLSIQSGDGSSNFQISGNEVQTTPNAIDYESLSSQNYIYTLVIIGVDEPSSPSPKTGTATVFVAINNINEFTPSITGTTPSTINIAESSSVGTSVCTVAASDADDGSYGTITFSISSGNTGNAFTIDPSSGVVYTATSLDYETVTSYSLVVAVTDGGGQSGTATVTATITDVNDNSPSCSPTVHAVDVQETTSSGNILTLACTDADGDALTYTITSGNSGADFALGTATGILSLNNALDYDSGNTAFTLSIDVTDGTSTETVTVNVNVVAENEAAPSFASNPTVNIDENDAVGTSVTTYIATDNDASPHDVVKYEIQSTTNGGTSFFAIDSTSGLIQISQSLDYETTISYGLTIVATDGGGLTATGTVTVSVTNVNDNSPDCTQSVIALTVAEDTATSTVVTSLTCTDADGNTLSYSMSQNPGSKFDVSASGDLTVNAALDYETTTYYQLQVTVTDDGTPALSTSVDIDVTVTNINEGTPSFTGTYSYTLSESTAVGTSVCTMTVTDSDSGSYGTVIFSIVGGNTGSAFTIDSSSGIVYTAKSLDRETVSSYNVEVRAADGGSPSLSGTTTVTVSISDVNDNPPSCSTTVYATNVQETKSSGNILTLTCTDADGDALTYSITSGNGGGDFSLTSASGILSLNNALDYDAGNTAFTLTIDVGDGTSTQTVTVNVNVIAENEAAPTFASNPTVNINENEAVGTSVTTYTATDADASPHDITKYEIQSATNSGTSFFGIDATSGLIQVSQGLDYETTQSYELAVVVTDGGGSKGTGTVTVSVTNVNDNTPQCTSTVIALNVAENTATTTVVTSLACSDADGNSLSYSMSQNPGSKFGVSASGDLTLTAALDFETTTFYQLQVTVTDGGTPALSTSVDIDVTVTNVNEGTPSFTGTYTYTIPEGTSVGTSVCAMIATDSDSGSYGTITFSITGGNTGSSFTIDSSSGIVYTAATLDRETVSSYNLEVEAADGGSPSLSGTTTVTVAISDVNDNAPSCSPTVHAVDVQETTASGNILTLTCTDSDGDTLSYSITSGNGGGDFSLTLASGSLSLNNALDYDSGNTAFTLTIDVSDGTSTQAVTVNVNVVAENEAAPIFASNPTVNINENEAVGTSVTTYTATDADASPHDITKYEIQSATNSGTSYFAIDATSGLIQISQGLDYETTHSYELTVVATDGGGSKGTGTVTVSVTNMNDNSPQCTPTVIALNVAENTATSTVVSSLACSDADGNSLSYSMSQNPGSKFGVSASGGLTVNAALDYETTTFYQLQVTVTDDGTPARSTSVDIDVTVTDINEGTPSFTGTYTYTISESTSVGTSICAMTATDSDSGLYGTITFSITGGNTGSVFTIDSSSGIVYTAATLDRETVSSYNLEVEAADGGSPSLSGTTTVTVTISDVNDNAPSCSPTVHAVDVQETTASGNILTLTCTDADGDTLSYTITSGNGGGDFSLTPASGILSLNNALDYDTGNKAFTLNIEVSDGTSSETVTVNINVVAENEVTPSFASNPTVTIDENEAVGTSVTTYAATDSDASPHDITKYEIQSASNSGTSYFAIQSTSGLIQIAQELDYETTQSYELTIVATDGGSSKGTGTVTVSVQNVNDNTPQCSPSAIALTVAENTATSTVVTSLACSDGDGNGLSYTMTQNPDSKFAIAASGDLTVNGALDFETTTYYQLQVTVTDDGTPARSTSVDIDVTITNVNEGAPVFSGTYSVTVPEDTSIGSTLITVTATDVDSDPITFSFQTSYANFMLDSASGAVILTQSLDFDTTPSHSLVVLASDETSLSTATVTVTVTDVNESPVFTASSYSATFDENVSIGTSVVTVTATDPDAAPLGTITYVVTSGNGGSYFTIDSSTGVITTTAAIDYETNTAFTLIVEASDGGSPSLSASALVQLTINDLNDNAPTFTAAAYTLNIGEDSAVGYSVTTVVGTDADSADNNNNVFTYSTSSSVPFTVGTTSGEISVNNALDRETTASYTMVILATDQGTPAQTGTLTLTITLDDVNDNDPVISGTYDTTISEYTTVNTVIFTIAASDTDSGVNGQMQYSILSGNTNSDFSIEQTSGIIQSVNSLDRETTSSYNLVVKVEDQGTPTRSATVTATVTILDENDNTPAYTQASFTFNVDENVGTGTSVGQVSATDSDTGSNGAVFYSIIGYWVGGSNPFTISSTTGVVTTSGSLDRETVDTYVLWCRVQDGGSPSLSSEMNISININDVNDNDPVFNQTSFDGNVIENSAVGTNILTVSASDNDIGVNGNLSYQIDTSTSQGSRADLFLAIDAYYGVISVKQTIDRESDASFTFVVIVSDAGSPVRTATVTTSVTVQDENDNNPIFSPTFYNTEVPYNDNCGEALATLTATDADVGVNAEISYSLYTVTDSHLFQVDSTTGEFKKAGTLDTTTYVMYSNASDNGSPQLSTGTSATIRIDGFSAPGVVLSFYMSINKTAYLSAESTFLTQLTAVYSPDYPTCSVKRWCINDQTSSIIVHIYVIENNIADDEANINVGKSFVHGFVSHAYVAADDSGTPASSITGASWDYFDITKVLRYTESSSTTTDTPWIQTTVGIATVTICCVGAVVIAVVSTILAIEYCRKKKTANITQDNEVQRVTVSSEGNRVRHKDPLPSADHPRPPSYNSARHHPIYNKGDPELDLIPNPVFTKTAQVSKGYIEVAKPFTYSGGTFYDKAGNPIR